MADVDDFCRKKGLDDYRALIRKGALVAQDPTGYEDIEGDEKLNDQEIQALRDEILHKWRVPFVLYLTVATCSIGAAVQGWDQTGSNGANLEFPYAFGIGSESIHDKLLVGLVNSAPYIGTSLFGCWLSDPLNARWGRRGTIFFSANFCLWPVIGSAFSNNWKQLFACRILLGIGMGTKASTGKLLISVKPAAHAVRNTKANMYCDSPYLCRREFASPNSRCLCHELADVDGFWYFPRNVCKCRCNEDRPKRMEIPIRFGLYPSCPLDVFDLLLPRVATLVYEEEPLPQCDEIAVTPTEPPDPSRSRPVLYPCATRGRAGIHGPGTLPQALHGALYYSSRAPCHCGFVCGHDRAADVWDQHNRILLNKRIPRLWS